MAIEIEAKVRLGDPESAVRRVEGLAGPCLSDVMETNVFLDTVDKALLGRDSGLRIRSVCGKDGAAVGGATVTYKGPRLPGAVKRREEIEFMVEDAAAALALLAALGYAECLRFEKRRRTWRYGRCEIVADGLPRIGEFLEVEGPSERAVRDILHAIGLSGEPLIREGYAEMVARRLGDARPAVLTFA